MIWAPSRLRASRLPEAPGQATPSGGFHRLFSTNGHGAAQTVKAIPGVDTRVGGKGYIVAWDPDGLPATDGLPAAPAWVYGERRTRKVKASFPTGGADIREGERDRALTSLAGSMRDRGMTEDAIYAALAVENEARCVPPLADRDVRRIAHSVARYTPEHARSVVADDDLDAVLGLRVMSAVTPLPIEPLLLGRYAPGNDLTLVYGPGGVGKGRLAAQDIAALSRAGHTVLIVDYEDHEQEWITRLIECNADLHRVLRVAPHGPTWGGQRGTIETHAQDLQAPGRRPRGHVPGRRLGHHGDPRHRPRGRRWPPGVRRRRPADRRPDGRARPHRQGRRRRDLPVRQRVLAQHRPGHLVVHRLRPAPRAREPQGQQLPVPGQVRRHGRASGSPSAAARPRERSSRSTGSRTTLPPPGWTRRPPSASR